MLRLPLKSTSQKVTLRLRIQPTLLYIFLVFAVPAVESCAQQVAPQVVPHSSWVLTWSDEFNGPDGSAPDPAKWIVESGGNGWGNNELEYYTPRAMLIPQASRASIDCTEGKP